MGIIQSFVLVVYRYKNLQYAPHLTLKRAYLGEQKTTVSVSSPSNHHQAQPTT